MSDLVISAQKYPKIVTQEEKKFQEINNTVFHNYIVFFTAFRHCVSHVYGHKKTSNRQKNRSLDKTGEGNVVSDLAISTQKNVKESATLFFKTTLFFYGVLTLFFTCFSV